MESGGESGETSDSSAPIKCYKKSREEAIGCRKTLRTYKIYDLDTGLVKEKYRKAKSPSPPTGTIVYEVRTGRPFEYIGDRALKSIPVESTLMGDLRKRAAAAGAWTPQTDRPGTSGLRRVIPVPAPPPTEEFEGDDDEYDDEEATPRELRRAREKVLNWRTSTPEPLESVTNASVADQRDACMCRCVKLVSSISIDLDTRIPDLAELDDRQLAENIELKQLLDESPTLRYLRQGYLNYVDATISNEEHQLVVYSCRSAAFKLYRKFKTVTCRLLRPRVTDPTWRGDVDLSLNQEVRNMPSIHRRAVALIDQYFNTFSAMCDFTYNWISTGGLKDVCNAIVVDKVYTYNHSNKCYVPYYRLLNGDAFTDLFVNHVKRCEARGIRLKHVRFVSACNTLLYTSGPTLRKCRYGKYDTVRRYEAWRRKRDARGDPVSREQKQEAVVETGVTLKEDSRLPLKKRNLNEPTEHPMPEAEGGDIVVCDDPPWWCHRIPSTSTAASNVSYLPSIKKWPRIQHVPSCSYYGNGTCASTAARQGTNVIESLDVLRYPHPTATESTESSGFVKNPTLIIFKQALDDKNLDTLNCNIIVEVHLGGDILY